MGTCLQVSAIISSACYSSWFLLAGFVVPRPVRIYQLNQAHLLYWPMQCTCSMQRSQAGVCNSHMHRSTTECMRSMCIDHMLQSLHARLLCALCSVSQDGSSGCTGSIPSTTRYYSSLHLDPSEFPVCLALSALPSSLFWGPSLPPQLQCALGSVWHQLCGINLASFTEERAELGCLRCLDAAAQVEGLIASQLGNVHDEYLALEDGTLVSCAEYIRIQYGYKWVLLPS